MATNTGRILFVLGLTTLIVLGPAMLAPIVMKIGVNWIIAAAFGCFVFAAVDTALDPWRGRRAGVGA